MTEGHRCEDVQETQDPALRERLASIPTGLTIPDEDVDELINAGVAEVKNSPELEAFRQSLETHLPRGSVDPAQAKLSRSGR